MGIVIFTIKIVFFLCNISQLAFLMGKISVHCEVETENLQTRGVNFSSLVLVKSTITSNMSGRKYQGLTT
jgi:hypothetical protein